MQNIKLVRVESEIYSPRLCSCGDDFKIKQPPIDMVDAMSYLFWGHETTGIVYCEKCGGALTVEQYLKINGRKV